MAPLPSRKTLEAMKRVDLQRICKDYGVRANLKSEALIDLLLDTQSTSTPQPTRRSVSTRIPSKAGPSRVSSMIVHDIEEEEENEENDSIPEDADANASPTSQSSLVPPPRTRKAKELQIRLGVGKPQAAGGNGPRAITRSSGSSRSKRLKYSRSMKPKEETIEEEPEAISALSKATEPIIQVVPSPPHRPQESPTPDIQANGSLAFKKIVDDAMRPLQDQIHSLKSKLDEVETIKSDLANLRLQVNEINKVQNDVKVEFQSLRGLSAVVLSLKEEIQQLREGLSANQTPPQPSTPKSRPTQLHEPPIGFGMPSTFEDLAGSPSTTRAMEGAKTKNKAKNLPPHPGIAESALGKRQRDSIASDITGIVEEGQEEGFSDGELAKKVLRPTKKRPRIDKEDATDGNSGQGRNSAQASSDPVENEQRETSSSNEDMQTFAVFRGGDEPLDYLDPPPPTNRLPDYFEPDSPTGSNTNLPRPKSTVSTSSAHAAENQPQAFGFGFLPISSTPQNPMYMPSFPYPEAPQSPSPAGPSLEGYVGRHDEQRMDIFKPFGFPSPIRSARHYGALSQDARGVNPAALTQGSSAKQRDSSSNDTQGVSSTDPTADPPISKRTMYGTELEGDTRFGDFGLEGMATDYWASGKY